MHPETNTQAQSSIEPSTLKPQPSTAAVPASDPQSKIENRESKIPTEPSDQSWLSELQLPPDWEFEVEPWPEPVVVSVVLDHLHDLLTSHMILPRWAADTLALFNVHTYAFERRDISTYIGIESPTARCGKTTLLTLLSLLINRPIIASSATAPSLFHAVEELRPTLMIDEADQFLKGKSELQGILNAGYCRRTAYVMRTAPQQSAHSKRKGSRLAFFSCWCPKVISQINRLPPVLADRCIVLRLW